MKIFEIIFEETVPEFPEDIVIIKKFSETHYLVTAEKLPADWYIFAKIYER